MRTRTPEQSEQLRKTSTWIFALVMAAFEIVIRRGADTTVFVFLGALLGFKPMVHLDKVFSKKPDPEPQTPAPEAAKEAAAP